jgi:hypothetical protein
MWTEGQCQLSASGQPSLYKLPFFVAPVSFAACGPGRFPLTPEVPSPSVHPGVSPECSWEGKKQIEPWEGADWGNLALPASLKTFRSCPAVNHPMRGRWLGKSSDPLDLDLSHALNELSLHLSWFVTLYLLDSYFFPCQIIISTWKGFMSNLLTFLYPVLTQCLAHRR